MSVPWEKLAARPKEKAILCCFGTPNLPREHMNTAVVFDSPEHRDPWWWRQRLAEDRRTQEKGVPVPVGFRLYAGVAGRGGLRRGAELIGACFPGIMPQAPRRELPEVVLVRVPGRVTRTVQVVRAPFRDGPDGVPVYEMQMGEALRLRENK